LPVGLESANCTVIPAVFPLTGFPLLTVTNGREAFVATTGVVMGIMNSRLEKASNARIVPELIFFTFVFILYFQRDSFRKLI
jgi:hypothetical protein